jgi:hypothetical protein
VPPRPAPVVPGNRETQPPRSDERVAALGPILREWERRGYQAQTQKRRVSMQLKDGRKLDVSVQEVRLQYVGGRTY